MLVLLPLASKDFIYIKYSNKLFAALMQMKKAECTRKSSGTRNHLLEIVFHSDPAEIFCCFAKKVNTTKDEN